MRVLLDTCAVSELTKPAPDAAVLAALEAIQNEDLFLSVPSVGEITKGIELLADGKRKRELQAWLAELERDYADRVLLVDLETAHIWGEVTARLQKAGKALAAIDGLIAATALRHGLHLMTRNEPDFIDTGVLVINPWTP